MTGRLLVINDISSELLNETLKNIESSETVKSNGNRAIGVEGNIRDPETVERLKQEALDFSTKQIGKPQVDILINNVN